MKRLIGCFIFILSFEVTASCLTNIHSELKNFYGKKIVLAENSRIQIIGPEKIQKIAKGILNRTERFYKNMEDLGFKIPELTQIHINKDSLLGRYIGPYYTLGYIDRWKGTTFSKIQINHYNVPNNQVIQSKSVVFHEQTHSVLFNTYNKNEAFVVADGPLQEALADYFSSSFIGSPKVGYNHHKSGTHLRNLETKEFTSKSKKVEVMDNIANTTENIHEYSLHYSNALWKIEQKIGRARMNPILKDILDDLNSFYASYAEVLKSIALPNRLNYNKQHFHYFLASIEETLKKHPGLKQELISTIETIKRDSGVINEDYLKIQAGLTRSNFDFTNHQEPVSRISSIVLPTLGASTLVALPTSLIILSKSKKDKAH